MVQRKAAGRRGQHLVAGFVSHKCWAVGAGRGLASCPDEIHLALRLATWGSARVSVYQAVFAGVCGEGTCLQQIR